MDDRIAEIREALDWWEDHGLARFSQREIDPVVDAARAYADLLDSDALIIRLPWPEWAIQNADVKTLERLWVASKLDI